MDRVQIDRYDILMSLYRERSKGIFTVIRMRLTSRTSRQKGKNNNVRECSDA